MLGLHCCRCFSLIAGSGSYSLVALHRLLIAVASLTVKHGLQDLQTSVVVTYGLSSSVPRLWRTGSIVVAHRLSCSRAHGIFPIRNQIGVSCTHAQLCPTLCNSAMVVHQDPLFMGLSRQKYWNELPFPSPGNLSNP